MLSVVHMRAASAEELSSGPL